MKEERMNETRLYKIIVEDPNKRQTYFVVSSDSSENAMAKARAQLEFSHWKPVKVELFM